MPRSFINKKIILPALLLFLGSLTLPGCSKSDDQKEFENEALNIPNGITETNESGKIKEDKNDSDDWRISPDYSGLLRVRIPAHPNPVLGNRFEIDILISGIDAIPSDRMDFLIIDETGNQYPISYSKRNLTTGSQTIFGQRLLAEIPQNEFPGLFRIIIYDGRENIISYGDVKVE